MNPYNVRRTNGRYALHRDDDFVRYLTTGEIHQARHADGHRFICHADGSQCPDGCEGEGASLVRQALYQDIEFLDNNPDVSW